MLDIRIRLRDGAFLSATLYLPSGHATPSPVVFTMTPYIAQTCHDVGVSYATHGLLFVAVDVRGRGNSDGSFHPLNEASDGYDTTEWLARQPYCNGQVAMWGGSYAGYCQWATARELPPHLATIVPVAAPYRGIDSPMRNNIFSTYAMRWLTFLAGRTLQEKMFADQAFWSRRFREWFESGTPYRKLDRFLGNPSPLFQEWLGHPHRDAYWDRHNPTAEQYAALSIPVLTITGSYDADQLGALAHYREHLKNASAGTRERHFLVIGPWDHAGTRAPQAEFCGIKVGAASVLDLLQLHLQWYAWTMQRGPKPEFLQKNVAYYVMGAERWRYADSLDAVTARSQPLFLTSRANATDVFSSGTLVTEPPRNAGPDAYIYDPRDGGLAQLESCSDPNSLTDQSMLFARVGKQLVYHSAPFVEDTEVSGFFKLVVWIAIDQPDTDFRVSVHEIGADGGCVLLSNDSMRARYRESARAECLVETQEPLRYEFGGFMFVSREIKRGSRLRLVIGPIDSIFSQKNYNSGGVVADESMQDARTVTVKIFHDERYPSTLHVPLGQPDVRE